MNMQNTVLASRIEAAFHVTIPRELIYPSLCIIARTPWKRYCGDAKARRMCRMVATSEMTALHLEQCGMEMPEWTGDVGGVAYLAVILDAATRRVRSREVRDTLIADRNVLVDGLLVPIRNYTMRNRAARARNQADQEPGQADEEASRSKRRRIPRHDFAFMARRYCRNELNANEARALFYVFCFSTAQDILDAVGSSPALSEGSVTLDFKRYSARAAQALKETRNCSAEIMCENCADERERMQKEGIESYRDVWDMMPEDPEPRLQRLALQLFFEPVALASRYGGVAADGQVQASPNPTLSARLAAA